MSYPATLLPAGEGRRGDLLPAPSPVNFNHTGEASVSANRSAKLNLQHSRKRSEAAARLQSAARLSRNSGKAALSEGHAEKEAFQGASPIGVGGRRAGLSPRGISPAHTPVKRKLTGVVPPARVCSLARANSPGAPASGVLSRSPAGASGRCDCPNRCDGTGCAFPSAAAWRTVAVATCGEVGGHLGRAKALGTRAPKSPASGRSALTSSAMTADPRRADPGNPLAGAVAARLRPYHWPVALRGGGHIAGVV